MIETFIDNLPAFLFWSFATVTALCAIAVVVAQNIVRSATWLLFTLGGVAGIFFLLGADFVGATQLLVYVGGTLVLVVFGVMLTAQGPFINMKSSPAEWAVSAVVGLLLISVLVVSICSEAGHAAKGTVATYAPSHRLAETHKSDDGAEGSKYADAFGLTFMGVGVGPAHTGRDGKIVRMNYLLPFEIVSVHLLVVLIGAAYLARAKRRARVRAEAPR
jgi:NADH:ubiquinone oxidoreductase subunit 6 (subunit J)